MKKYWIIHTIFILLFLILSYLLWRTPYSHTFQLVSFVIALALAIVILYIVRDEFLKAVKSADFEAYKRMVNISGYEKSYKINIEKTYPYNEKTQDLIDLWSNYTWLTFATIIIPFVLLLLSDR